MMKKLTCALLAVFLVLSLTACGRSLGNREAEVNMNQGSEIDPTDSMECYDLTGLWHLDEKACAGAELSEMFSGFAEWGSSMEVRSDGRISWYIGAESWTGTYIYNNDCIIAAMKSDLNEAEKDWQLYFAPNDDDQVLIMDYGDAKLVWEYGEQDDAPMGDE